MKRLMIVSALIILVMLSAACASSKPSSAQSSGDGAPSAEGVGTPAESEPPCSEINDGAPPAVEFGSAEEAVKEIKAVKAAGADRMAHPDDFKLYEKDHIYLLKENPLPGFEQAAIMLTDPGTLIYYQSDNMFAMFSWDQGGENAERTGNLTDRYGLKRYKDTNFYFGNSISDIYIYWWEHGDQFCFRYPIDSNIVPEDIIERLEVERYDL